MSSDHIAHTHYERDGIERDEDWVLSLPVYSYTSVNRWSCRDCHDDFSPGSTVFEYDHASRCEECFYKKFPKNI